MIRLNHLALLVSSYRRSRDWYTANLGLELEFEIPERNTVALQDDGGLTLFLSEPAAGAVGATCTLAFEVDGCDVSRARGARRRVRENAAEALLGLRRRAARSRRLSHLSLGRGIDARERHMTSAQRPPRQPIG
jgi:catechol 2,3-dioxygenase-like lactoylglutathione lyase family enzyme